ncbi:MAG: hypothetical protein A2034_06315 [Elusimicrobia bacterium GWA2_38_7]|nr:MAG: hypothetical protein A2034_06315 [Elusimicrobia bacterium GWA2_38_7]
MWQFKKTRTFKNKAIFFIRNYTSFPYSSQVCLKNPSSFSQPIAHGIKGSALVKGIELQL